MPHEHARLGVFETGMLQVLLMRQIDSPALHR